MSPRVRFPDVLACQGYADGCLRPCRSENNVLEVCFCTFESTPNFRQDTNLLPYSQPYGMEMGVKEQQPPWHECVPWSLAMRHDQLG